MVYQTGPNLFLPKGHYCQLQYHIASVAPTGGLPRWQPQQPGGTAGGTAELAAPRALRSALRGGAVDAVRGRPGVLGDPAWLGLEEWTGRCWKGFYL